MSKMEKLLKIPYAVFNDWDLLQQFLDRRGNPMYEIVGDVNLFNRKDISDLGNLVRVDGFLDLYNTSVQSLGNLEYVSEEIWLSDDHQIPQEELNKFNHTIW